MTRTKWLTATILFSGMLIVLTACNLSDILRRIATATDPDTRVTLQAKDCSPDADIGLMNKAQQIVQERLIGLGASNVQVEVQDACHLTIDLSASNTLTQTIDTVRRSGRLEFVDTGIDFYSEGTLLRTTGNPSPTLPVSNTFATTTPDKVYQVIVTGADFLPDEFKVVMGGPNSQYPEIAFQLNAAATQKFKEFTTTHNEMSSGKQYYLCIVLDNEVVSCPSIRMSIPDGKAVIAVGPGSVDGAQRLMNLFRFGSLPYTLEVIQSEPLPFESESKP